MLTMEHRYFFIFTQYMLCGPFIDQIWSSFSHIPSIVNLFFIVVTNQNLVSIQYTVFHFLRKLKLSTFFWQNSIWGRRMSFVWDACPNAKFLDKYKNIGLCVSALF